jgi:hypothetical protein
MVTDASLGAPLLPLPLSTEARAVTISKHPSAYITGTAVFMSHAAYTIFFDEKK